jgi:zinc protease
MNIQIGLFVSLLLMNSMAWGAPVERIRLPQGPQVYFFPDERIPVIDLLYVSPRGTHFDPVGQSGAFELLSQVLVRGAGGLDAHTFSESLEQQGAQLNSQCGDDFCTVHIHGRSQDQDLLTQRWIEVLTQPMISSEEVEKEKKRFLDQMELQTDQVGVLASRVLSKWVAQGTSYGRAGWVSRSEFENLKEIQLREIFKDSLQREDGSFLVIGKYSKDKIVDALKNKWKSGSSKNLPSLKGLPHFKDELYGQLSPSKLVLVNRPKATQATFVFSLKSVPLVSEDYLPLVVANAALGGMFQSRLNRVIRDELGLTYGIESSLGGSLEVPLWNISAATRNEKVGEFLDSTLVILKRFLAGDIQESEVELAKEFLKGQYPLGLATRANYALGWFTSLLHGLDENFVDEYPQRLSRVNLARIRAALSRIEAQKDLRMVVAGDASVLLPVLKKAGYSPQKVLNRKDLW